MSTPRELLPAFYAHYNLGADGGLGQSSVRVEITPWFKVYIPNFDARRKAVLKHDIHHLATGYTSLMKGETEISAWEIASGCKRYWAAFAIDLYGMMAGVPWNLRGIFKAFVKGRRCRNLYSDAFTEVEMMDMPVAEIKEWMGFEDARQKRRATFGEWAAFLGYLALAGVYTVASVVLLPFVLGYTVWVLMRGV